MGLATVGEVAGLSEDALVSILGQASGRHLHALAHNRDPRRVRTGRRRRSMGAQRALGRSRRPDDFLESALIGLVDRLTRRLRGARRTCRTVTLRLRFGDFSRATRSQTFAEATARTQPILAVARELLLAALPMIERRGITLIGVTLGNLANDDATQLALQFERRPRWALDSALDEIRERYGSAAITRAGLVGRSQGPSVPLLPD